jgi:hypothetical protein
LQQAQISVDYMAPPDTIDALAASVDVIATGTIER